jgi:hypothetical protein
MTQLKRKKEKGKRENGTCCVLRVASSMGSSGVVVLELPGYAKGVSSFSPVRAPHFQFCAYRNGNPETGRRRTRKTAFLLGNAMVLAAETRKVFLTGWTG